MRPLLPDTGESPGRPGDNRCSRLGSGLSKSSHSMPPSSVRPLPPHSFRLSRATIGVAMSFLSDHSCSVTASLRGVWGFPHTSALLTISTPIREAQQLQRSDTSGKELWHRVISPGHSPSADVREQSYSCRWDFVLHQPITSVVPPAQEPFPHILMLTNSNVACWVCLCLCYTAYILKYLLVVSFVGFFKLKKKNCTVFSQSITSNCIVPLFSCAMAIWAFFYLLPEGFRVEVIRCGSTHL